MCAKLTSDTYYKIEVIYFKSNTFLLGKLLSLYIKKTQNLTQNTPLSLFLLISLATFSLKI